MILAVIGNGEEVQTLPVVCAEYNIATGVITLLTHGHDKIEVDTSVIRVALSERGRVCNTFNGEVIDYA